MRKMSQSAWNIYVRQNVIVYMYVIKRLKPLFLDPYFQSCKYSRASKFFCLSILPGVIVIFVGSSPRTFTVRSIREIESLCF